MYSFSFRSFLTLILLAAALLGRPGNGRSQSISTVAGIPGAGGYSGDGGSSISAKLQYPLDVVTDGAGNLYIADYTARVVRKVNASTGIISTVAGNGQYGVSGDGGPATAASLGGIYGLAVDVHDNLYIADGDDGVIRKVDASGIITTVAGMPGGGYSGDGGPATAASLGYPTNMAVNTAGDIYIADTYNNVVRKVDGGTGIITTVAGGGSSSSPSYNGPATGAQLGYVNYVALDAAGNLYLTDFQTVRRMDASGKLTTIAGNGGSSSPYDYSGPATAAGINAYAVTVDANGNLYLTDIGSNTIRKVDAAGNMTNYAGNGHQGYGGDNGPATDASVSLNGPNGLTTDVSGNVYFADSYNHVIRKVGSVPPPQTITLSDITVYYGMPDFVPAASASSGGPITYTVDDRSLARVNGGDTIHILKTGTTTITATQAGSFNWQPASATVKLTILQPNQSITFSDIQVIEGSPDFALTATASSGLPVSYSVADPTIATITNGVVHLLRGGATTITASQAGDGSTWTPAAPVTVTLTVTQDIVFGNMVKTYGDVDFVLTSTPAGGQPVVYTVGDSTVAVLVNSNTLHIRKAGTMTVSVGIVGASGLPVTATLTVNKASLTITPDNLQKQQGQENPPLTVSYSGFVNGENNAVLAEQPTAATTAITSSPVGVYPITVSGAAAANYLVKYDTGTLTIGPAAGAVRTDGLNALIEGGTLQARVAAVKGGQALLQVVDVAGNVVLSRNITLGGGQVNSYTLPVFNLSHGAYIVTVRGNGMKLVDKIIY